MVFKSSFVKRLLRSGGPRANTVKLCESTDVKRALPLVLALVACGKKADEPPPPPPPVVVTPSGVELVKPGAEPRQVVRYQLGKGAKSTLELAVDVDLVAGGMGGPMPTLVMTMEIGADDVLPDGRMRVRSTVTKVVAKDRPGSKFSADTMTRQAGLLVGLGIVGTLAPNGTLTDAHLDAGGKPVPPEMQAQLGSLTKGFERVALPLPDAPVGAGAVWRTKKEVEESGAHMTAITTIALGAIHGTTLELTRTAEVTGPDQKLTQMGVEVTMKNIAGKGGGHGTLDLARMVFDGEMSDELHDELAGGGQTMQAAMTMKSTYTAK